MIEVTADGFSVESAERVLVPHLYRVTRTEEARSLVFGGNNLHGRQARAVWCHLLPAEGASRYGAGFELARRSVGGEADARSEGYPQAAEHSAEVSDGAVATATDNGDLDRRQAERSEHNGIGAEVLLEAVEKLTALSYQREPPRIRIKTRLLPSLQSSVQLELNTVSHQLTLFGQIADVGPWRPADGAPQSWLGIDLTRQSAEDLCRRIDS